MCYVLCTAYYYYYYYYYYDCYSLGHSSSHHYIYGVPDICRVPPPTHDIYIVSDLMDSDLSRIISSPQVAIK